LLDTLSLKIERYLPGRGKKSGYVDDNFRRSVSSRDGTSVIVSCRRPASSTFEPCAWLLYRARPRAGLFCYFLPVI